MAGVRPISGSAGTEPGALQMHSLSLPMILCLGLCLGDLLPCALVKIYSSSAHGSLCSLPPPRCPPPCPSSPVPLQTCFPGTFTTSVCTVLVCPSLLPSQLHESRPYQSPLSLCPHHLARFLIAAPLMLSGCVSGPSRKAHTVMAEEVALPLLGGPPTVQPPSLGGVGGVSKHFSCTRRDRASKRKENENRSLGKV